MIPRADGGTSGRTRGRLVRVVGALLLAGAISALFAGGGATAATPSMTVALTVPSFTYLDATGCAGGVAGKTNLGTVLPSSLGVTTIDCSVIFGSGNDTSMLRLTQTDTVGVGMWMQSVGALDTTFDTDGRVSTAMGSGASTDDATAVAVQGDGKVVIAGNCGTGATGGDFCLARYMANGALDTSFDTDGLVTTAIGPTIQTDAPTSLAVQADGKIVAAGVCYMDFTTGYDACLARYNTDGSLDPSFDVDGRAVTAVFADYTDRPYALVVQPDGKILSAGQCDAGAASAADACLWRYNANGSLDTSFDTDGIVNTATSAGAGLDRSSAVALQADGKIVAAGSCTMGATALDVCLTRYNVNGSLDTSFDTDGILTTAVGAGAVTDRATAVMVQGDGKVLTAGFCDMGATGTDSCLVRYTASGALDATFDADGIVTTATGAGGALDRSNALAAWTDGKLVTAGACFMGGATGDDACLAAYDQGGRVSNFASGSADWSTAGTSLFGACLKSVAAGASTDGSTWAATGSCGATNADPWKPIVTTAGTAGAKVAASTTIGNAAAQANLRFGVRTSAGQTSGGYVAPVVFDVSAPNI